MRETTSPAQRLVHETIALLEGEAVSPECAFTMIRFAAEGSEEADAWAQLARLYNQGIGCEKNKTLSMDALRKSGKADWLLPQDTVSWLNPEDEPFPSMDEDVVYVEQAEENRLVDAFLDSGEDETLARYARYDTANPGCSPEKPIVIAPSRDYKEAELRELESLLRPIPYRYVDYEVSEQCVRVRNGRWIDHVRVRVSTHPLLTEDADGELYLPKMRFLGYEDYWFDIPGYISAFHDYQL